MNLSSGVIVNPENIKGFVNEMTLYRSETKMYANYITLLNTSDNQVSINLKVIMNGDVLQIRKKNYVIESGDTLRITDKYYLDLFDEIRCSVSTDNVIHYVINGGIQNDQADLNGISLSFESYLKPTEILGTLESDQILKLIPSELDPDEVNGIYNSYSRSQNTAKEDSADTKKYLLKLSEPADITITNGGLTDNNDFNDYVNIRGLSSSLNNLILTDKTYLITEGSVMIEDVTLKFSGSGTGNPKFNGFKFKNVYMIIDCLTFELLNCSFEGVCYIKMSNGTLTFTDSIGGIVVTNGELSSDVFGYFEKDINKF